VQRAEQAWAGIDAGKEHHHVVVIDSDGHRLFSRRVLNGESELGKVIDAGLDRANTVTWAIDLADGPAALMITLLLERGRRLVFLPGVAVKSCFRRLPGSGQDRRYGRRHHR
jgi:Transposase